MKWGRACFWIIPHFPAPPPGGASTPTHRNPTPAPTGHEPLLKETSTCKGVTARSPTHNHPPGWRDLDVGSE